HIEILVVSNKTVREMAKEMVRATDNEVAKATGNVATRITAQVQETLSLTGAVARHIKTAIVNQQRGSEGLLRQYRLEVANCDFKLHDTVFQEVLTVPDGR